MDIASLHQIFLQCSSVSTDTRKITPNCLFVALKGDRFDANTFAAEALQKGAAYVIIDNPSYQTDHRTILVQDSLTALQQLANYHRRYLGTPIVALTGSNGKTTTKELIHAVLRQKFHTTATIGNLNNHIGVPLTLLSFNKQTEIGIVEMGANHQKEIEMLCKIAEPDFGYITNFGKAHLEGFGGVEGVIKGKSEMYDYLFANGKKAFVNLQDPIQVQKTQGQDILTFGLDRADADVSIASVTANPLVTVYYQNLEIRSHLIGLYNANNINAALAMGLHFGLTPEQIKTGIEGYVPENNRSQLLRKGSNEIILDAYNANPSSMAVAIENFVQLSKPNKLMVLGDMFELGQESAREHQNIVQRLAQNASGTVYFVGKDFYASAIAAPGLAFFADFDALSEHISQHPPQDSLILIKGSRGMALERLLEFI